MTTPPPPPPSDSTSGPTPAGDQPGQQPFQPPQPGQSPTGDQPGQQPFQPPQPGKAPSGPAHQAGPGAPQAGAAQGKPKMSKPVLYALIAALVVVVGGAIIFGIISSQSEPQNAEAGDCITVPDGNANDAEIVDCGSTDAQYEVVDVVDAEADCASTDATSVLYITEGDETTYYCLTEVG